jgi:predicted nuclease of predicted toxin-antitoxin system
MPLKLYLDENLSPRLAEQLRLHGFDVIATHESNRTGTTDASQLAFAANENRTIVTINHRDFAMLHEHYLATGQTHAGIILTTEEMTQTLRRRLLRLLNTLTMRDVTNQMRWLNEFKSPNDR